MPKCHRSAPRPTLPFGRVSSFYEAEFCVEALNEVIHRFGAPEIRITDQGSRFKSFAWAGRLKRVGAITSMDGEGLYIGNFFIERVWRSLKYECVDLHKWEPTHRSRPGSAVG